MKKTIAILLVLAIVLTGAFAALVTPTASNATVTLNGSVGPVLIHGLSDTTMNVSAIKSPAAYNPSASSTKDLFDADGVKANVTVFYSYMTNWKGTVTATATFDPLASASATVTTKVGYTVKIGNDTTNVASTGSKIEVKLFDAVTTGTTGFAGDEKQLVFNAVEADYLAAAAADDYTATVTFTIAAN